MKRCFISREDSEICLPDKSNEITIKGDGFFETVAQEDGSILVKPKWISVEKSLPEPFKLVLVACGCIILVAKRNDDKENIRWIPRGCFHDQWITGFTHWMELPNFPEEE